MLRIVTLIMAAWLCGSVKASAADGQRIFSTTCAACHGLDGHGGEHAPDIATAAKIRAMTDQELTQLVHNGVPASGMPAFGESLKADEIQAVIGYLRVLQNQQGHTVLSGNPARGQQIFFGNAGCAECHLMNAKGGFIGPELSSFGKIHNEYEILQAIVEPNKNFDVRHAMAEVSMHDGKAFRGVIRNEDNFSIQLQDIDGSYHLLNKADVAAIKRQKQSLMPDNYGTKLSKADLDDLIAYLVTAASGKPSQSQDDDDN